MMKGEVLPTWLAPKALLLDGGGLGGGVSAESGRRAQDGIGAQQRSSRATTATPPSPTLPPSRGKGVLPKALPLNGEGLGWGVFAMPDQHASFGANVAEPSSPFDHDRHTPGAVSRARRLRQTAPLSEQKLWDALRKLKLGIRRQAPLGRFIADFAHHGARLVIEVDGRRHDLPDEQLKDVERDAWLAPQGYRVIRVRDDLAYGRPFDVAERIGQIILVRTGKATAPTGAPRVEVSDTPPSPALPPLRGKGE